ncbi:MAG: hypothetical protein AB203_02795 [Parcubacteria bacterium C7867-008]|nr:MAG: hypothetical protein AB203_02795 [Parcubacteria bacterium C7867-008]
MIDLGIFNFIKNARAQGQTDEAIRATLTAQGMDEAQIAEVLVAVEGGIAPVVENSETPRPEIHTSERQSVKNSYWGYFMILVVIAVMGGIFFLGSKFLPAQSTSNENSAGKNPITAPINAAAAATAQVELRTVQASAEAYRDQSGSYGMSSSCDSGGMFGDASVRNALSKIANDTRSVPICRSNATAYVVQIKFSEEKYLCADSTNYSGLITKPLSSGATSCAN